MPRIPRQTAALHPWLSNELAMEVLTATLMALRQGTLAAVCDAHPHLVRGLIRRKARALAWMFDLRLPSHLEQATLVALRWFGERLRPDGRPPLDPIPVHAWTGASAWRPCLAVLAHSGLMPVPDMAAVYRSRRDEPAFEKLCGLWRTTPSSFYRSLERGKKLVLEVAERPRRPGDGDGALCDLAWHLSPPWQPSWTNTNVQPRAEAQHPTWFEASPMARLLAAAKSNDLDAFALHVSRLPNAVLSGDLVDHCYRALALTSTNSWPELQAQLAMALALRLRGKVNDEGALIDACIRQTRATGQPELVGAAVTAKATYLELRDMDQALAAYAVASEQFEAAHAQPDAKQRNAGWHAAWARSQARWTQQLLLRNDRRSTVTLERADEIAKFGHCDVSTLGLLEQVRAEYLRRAGDAQGAIASQHRALQLYEQGHDITQAQRACAGLMLMYAGQKNLRKVKEYGQRIFSQPPGVVDPRALSAAHLNLGAAHFWQSEWTSAIDAYTQALDVAKRSSLPMQEARALYNLAEAHFERHRRNASSPDAAAAEFKTALHHAEASRAMWLDLGDHQLAKAVDELIATARSERNDSTGSNTDLGDDHRDDPRGGRGNHQSNVGNRAHASPSSPTTHENLLPDEHAIHFEPMTRIRVAREELARSAGSPNSRAKAQLAIAAAYATMARIERDHAWQAVHANDLANEFGPALVTLFETTAPPTAPAEQRATRWLETVGCPVPKQHVLEVVRQAHAADRLSKDSYRRITGLSPATASSHLMQLVGLRLLVRTGRGPATRYALAKASLAKR